MTSSSPAPLLEELMPYNEEPFVILESYFEGKQLERLVRHQIESYNHFINIQLQKTIEMFNPVVIHSDKDYVEEKKQYFLEIFVSFANVCIYEPLIYENNGATKTMFPQEARLRNFTYSANTTVDLQIKYVIRDTEDMETPKIIEKTMPKINIGKIPIMLKSDICILKKNTNTGETGECPYDCGGYFIIKGSEKTVLGQERAAENKIYCFRGKTAAKSWYAEIKSVPDFKCISPKQIELFLKDTERGTVIYIKIPRIKQPVELCVLYRALGVAADKAICEYILLDVAAEKNAMLLEFLQPSILESHAYATPDDAMASIVSLVAFTPPLTMDREAGLLKKREFTMEVLNTDLLPHCQTMKQKLYLVGYMARQLIETCKGWRPPDDRDSYVNKRIELTGTLLNNLYRNYFNKLVKEMQKLTIREINARQTRTMDDYENILNMTNIYKIIKPATIENGISRALSTGDFSIKQSNSSKVGVGQVLNRLTYPATVSHLRRINTPLDKNGELVEPRKLHGSTWGFLCVAGDCDIVLYDGTTKKMCDIVETDCVMTVDRVTLRESPSRIHNLFSKMPETLYEIRVLTGETIRATGDHPFLTFCQQINQYKMKSVAELGAHQDQLVLRQGPGAYTHVRIHTIVKVEPVLVYDFTTYSVNHTFVASSFVVSNCAVETPEGQSIGIVKNIAYMAHITIPTSSAAIYEHVNHYIHSLDELPPAQLYKYTKVFVNGAWVGVAPNPVQCYAALKQLKYTGRFNIYTSIVFDYKLNEIRVCNDGGRLTRPLLRVGDDGRVLMTRDILDRLRARELTWNDLLLNLNIPQSVIEYIDVEEQGYAMIALYEGRHKSHIDPRIRYTHCEIHPSTILGMLASCIPFPEHNQAPRNTYECAQIKQAMGVYATNYHLRMDKTAYILTYPTRPLIDTRLMNFIGINNVPSGCQITVAIAIHTGYNQEDSLLINRGSIDRGMFMTTIYHVEKDEDNNLIRDEIIRCKPDPMKTRGIKLGNYEKLNANGFIPENTRVENRDVIIAKIIPIKEHRNDPTKVVKYEDQSKIHRTFEESYIDLNYTGRNGDGYNFAKTRIRTLRKPVIGDKFSSRHGQKGTCGNIIDEWEMPFTKDGLRPDIILNPHAIPSRMTIGQLKETVFGKVLVELGILGDGTAFSSLDIVSITDLLSKLGFHSRGEEIMYDGLTGEPLETSVFIGPVYYQRLKHMVNDKQHSRAFGPMVNLTRQPAEGRSRDGGFRVGEMERDVLIAHGMSRFCKERLYDVSDKYSCYVCKKCGMIAPYYNGDNMRINRANDHFVVHNCNTCNNMTSFAKVDIPFTFKLLCQELQTINIVPRIVTE
jgi:DNA-directed RNA polymerase beta subunit